MSNLVNGLGGPSGFGENNVPRGDDNSGPSVSLVPIFGAQGLNYFGTTYTNIFVNTNGSATFGEASGTFFQREALRGGYSIIAPFHVDVDTRLSNGATGPDQVTPTPGGTSRGSDLVWYDTDTPGTLTITWDDVGYFDQGTDLLNAFQLQLIGTGGGDFDVVFRYEAINWAQAPDSARAGFGTPDGTMGYELPQSGDQSSMLLLEDTPGNTTPAITGEFRYSLRSGTTGANTISGADSVDIVVGLEGDDSISGSGGDDSLFGGADEDTLAGGEGNDSVDGGSGVDSMVGGLGDDVYVAGTSTDLVVESAAEGLDSVQTSSSFTLSANVENLTLLATGDRNGAGNALDNAITGNSGINQLEGGGGNDTLDGGAGADTLTGWLGADRLVWDAADARIDGGTGTDMLRIRGSGVTIDLTLIADDRVIDVERINLAGSGDNELILALADVLAISSSTDRLRVHGNAGDDLTVNGGGWTDGGVSGSYHIYTQGTATLLVDTDMSVAI